MGKRVELGWTQSPAESSSGVDHVEAQFARSLYDFSCHRSVAVFGHFHPDADPSTLMNSTRSGLLAGALALPATNALP
jgi:hypothetical protein